MSWTSLQMKNMLYMSCSSMLLMSIVWGISSETMVSSWVSLEINFLMFLGMISFNNNLHYSFISLKYFLTQAIGSVLIIWSLVLETKLISINLTPFFLMFGVIWKLGAAPFHLWYLHIASEMSPFNFMVLSTAQKVIPLFMLEKIPLAFGGFIGTITLLISILGTFNQNNFKKIFIFSSLFTLSWMVISLMKFQTLFMVMMLFYLIMFAVIASYLSISFSLSFQKMSVLEANSSLVVLILISLMIISGFPPFMGFYLKIMILKSMVSMKFLFLSFILASVFMIYMYMSIFLNSLSFLHMSNKIGLMKNYKVFFSLWAMSIISYILPLCAI